MNRNPRSLMDRALGWAITFVVVALLVRWGWEIIRPFTPLLLAAVLIVVVAKILLARYRRS
jgi:hypothetical protein